MASCVVPVCFKRMREETVCSGPEEVYPYKRPRISYLQEQVQAPVANMRKALMFLQQSSQHAMNLVFQNQWDRALQVLEKIERAAESVAMRRRQTLLQKLNATAGSTCDSSETATTTTSTTQETRLTRVRFAEEAQVQEAEDFDRKYVPSEAPSRAEMLVLRAVRAIPTENYSEFWN